MNVNVQTVMRDRRRKEKGALRSRVFLLELPPSRILRSIDQVATEIYHPSSPDPAGFPFFSTSRYLTGSSVSTTNNPSSAAPNIS